MCPARRECDTSFNGLDEITYKGEMSIENSYQFSILHKVYALVTNGNKPF